MWTALLNWDWQIAEAIFSFCAARPWLAQTVTWLNWILLWLLAAGAALILYRRRRPLVFTIVGGLGAYIGGRIIALINFRPRPFVAHQFVALVNESPLTKSFPSNHAMAAFALAAGIWLVNKKWGAGALVVATLIAVLRVAAGVHYLFDVLVGAILGWVAVWIAKKFI